MLRFTGWSDCLPDRQGVNESVITSDGREGCRSMLHELFLFSEYTIDSGDIERHHNFQETQSGTLETLNRGFLKSLTKRLCIFLIYFSFS